MIETQADYIAEMRTRKLPEGIKWAEKFIGTDHGFVMLKADNWNAIADVLGVIEKGKAVSESPNGQPDCEVCGQHYAVTINGAGSKVCAQCDVGRYKP